MKTLRRRLGLALPVLAALSLSACLAVAAGAGAGAAIAWTQRGASSLAPGSIDDVFDRSVTVFAEMQIARTGESTRDSGRKRTLTGRVDDRDVTVEMDWETGSTTRVEVYARRSAVEWDRQYARDVLTRIVGAEAAAAP